MFCIMYRHRYRLQVEDFDGQVIAKLTVLSEKYGEAECIKMLDNLEARTRFKQVRQGDDSLVQYGSQWQLSTVFSRLRPQHKKRLD